MTRALLALPLLAAGLAGCSDESAVADARVPGQALFAPSTGVLPVPSDFLYSGTTDATLNPPVVDAADFSDPLVAVSALDGWSPSAPSRVEFSRPLDPDSIVPGESVRLFQVTTEVTPTAPVGGAVQSIVGEVLGFEAGLAPEDASNQTLEIRPTAPLQAATSYMLVITTALLDSEGFAMSASQEFVLGGADEPWPDGSPLLPLQGRIVPMLDAALTQGIEKDRIVLANVFTTQSIGDVTGTLAMISGGGVIAEQAIIDALCAQLPNPCDSTLPDPLSVPVLGGSYTALGTTDVLLGGGPGLANVFQGSVTLPYYSTASINASMTGTTNDAAPLTEFWRARYQFVPGNTENNLTRFNPLPAITGQEIVPMLVTVPNVGMAPASGWPVVIFQHGITGNRSQMLAIADQFAAEGLACVAIDLPLHGITDTLSGLFTSFQDSTLRERTFGIDLLNNLTGAPGPDGTPDASGAHYINLVSLLVTRDNLRQAHADLLNLTTLVPDIDTDGDLTLDFDPARIHFVGHSLGAIVGIGAFAGSTDVVSSTFAMPGGGLAKMLVESTEIGPTILAGLSAAGVEQGTEEFEQFLFAAQTATDAGDPVNYAQAYAAPGRNVHLIEILGDPGASVPADTVIPPTVPGAPLSGTEPLIELMGLPAVSTTTTDAGGVSGAVRFLEGTHRSILDPTSIAAFTEIQTQVARFASSSGTEILVTNETIVQ